MADYNKRLREGYMQNKEMSERERLLEQNAQRLEMLGGVERQKEQIFDAIRLPLEYSRYYELVGIPVSTGILVQGPCGSGKTSFVHAIARECKLPVIPLKRADFVSRPGHTEDAALGAIKKASLLAPAIMFIDEIDEFCRKKEALDNEADRRVVSRVIECIDSLPKGVIFIGAATNPDEIDPALRRSGRLDRDIKLTVPTESERAAILDKHLSVVRHRVHSSQWIAKHTPGYVGADLRSLILEAGSICIKRGLQCAGKIEMGPLGCRKNLEEEQENKNRSDNHVIVTEGFEITEGDITEALGRITPSARKEGFVVIPEVDFEDIGALHDVKRTLEMSIVQPSLYPEKFLRVGIKRPAGVLLYGPPGTGKTMLARAIAGKSHCNFISVKGPELLSMYYGESERAIRKVFSRARSSQPCVIFFDEIDSICGKRGGSTSRHSDTLVNQLLVEMDGLEERGAVYLIGATNRLDIIDKALLRPGRFDIVLQVNPPQGQDLVEILGKKLSKVSTDGSVDPALLPMDGLTGAEIDLLVREAGSICLLEDFHHAHPCISQRHLQLALERIIHKKRQ